MEEIGITKKEFLDYLGNLVGEEIRSKYNPDYKAIISGIARMNDDPEKYVVVINSQAGGFHARECIDSELNITQIYPKNEPYKFNYFQSNGTGTVKYYCLSLREFFETYYFVDKKNMNLSYMSLDDARKIFACNSGDLEELKIKLLCIYSKRELLYLPEKIDNICYPKDVCVGGSSLPYPNQETLDSAIAYQKLVWLVGEYISRWRTEMGLSILADLTKYETYCIVRVGPYISVFRKGEISNIYTILSFPDYNLAKIFYQDHRELIYRYYML